MTIKIPIDTLKPNASLNGKENSWNQPVLLSTFLIFSSVMDSKCPLFKDLSLAWEMLIYYVVSRQVSDDWS